MRIALDPQIEELARKNAWFVASVSGGKDSGAALHTVNCWLDSIGHDPARRLALHADLGRAEWPETLDTVREVANFCNTPLEILSATKDLVWRFEDRWRRSLERYRLLETVSVVPPWSSSSLLFCRAEQKQQVLSRRKAKLDGNLPVVGIIGIRRAESRGRSTAPVLGLDGDMIKRHGRQGFLWNPIVDWETDEVFDYHSQYGIPLHRAYGLGSTRLSCAYCTLASKGDQRVSYGAGNHETYRAYVSLEIRSAFPFQKAAWLADLIEDHQTDKAALDDAKRIAAERVRLQSEIPATLLKSQSIRNITTADAATLASIRSNIAKLYGIDVLGTTGDEIMHMSKERKAA